MKQKIETTARAAMLEDGLYEVQTQIECSQWIEMMRENEDLETSDLPRFLEYFFEEIINGDRMWDCYRSWRHDQRKYGVKKR